MVAQAVKEVEGNCGIRSLDSLSCVPQHLAPWTLLHWEGGGCPSECRAD